VPTRALHVSDLHAGRHEAAGLADGLAALVAEVEPELVIATGDLSHRGRPEQLAHAREVIDRLETPVLAVPGNHDIPYSFPARFSRPWAEFERVFGPLDPVYQSKTLVVCGLDSVRPWRHQGGRLSPARLALAAETLAAAPPTALRVVALHHHLAGAPWRTSRKFPLKHRDAALRAFAAAGAELVLGGHIHQSTAVERHEIEATSHAGSLVLATAPGLGRPRPHRLGEAQGVHVYEWSEERLVVVTRIWDGTEFRPTARRAFPREYSHAVVVPGG
jgi:3',5'-cyclic AMP phosphodiesterase CpdA